MNQAPQERRYTPPPLTLSSLGCPVAYIYRVGQRVECAHGDDGGLSHVPDGSLGTVVESRDDRTGPYVWWLSVRWDCGQTTRLGVGPIRAIPLGSRPFIDAIETARTFGNAVAFIAMYCDWMSEQGIEFARLDEVLGG